MNETNRYQPGLARVDDVESSQTVRRPPGLLVVAVIQALVALAVALLAPQVLPAFELLFGGFMADIPAGTRFLLEHPRMWRVFAVIGAVIAIWPLLRWRIAARELRRMKLAVRGFTSIFGAALVLAILALYLPLLLNGAAV